MPGKNKRPSRIRSIEAELGCCRVDSVVTVDARGQLVLPKEVREKAGIKAGDKLAVVSCEQNGNTCCIALIKAEGLEGMVKGLLGPLFGK